MSQNQLYDKKLICPVCKNAFTSKKVKQSGVNLVRRDADFCGYYQYHNPIFYMVYICPNCGYGAMESDFDKIDKYQIQAVKDRISVHWNQRAFDGERDVKLASYVHKMCLYNYTVIGRDDSSIAKVCLRLAWLYRMKGIPDQEKHFVEYALKHYQLAYEKENLAVDPEHEMLVYYLIGELSRQLDKYKEAMYWYRNALRLPFTKTRKNIKELIQDQIQVVKDIRTKMIITTEGK